MDRTKRLFEEEDPLSRAEVGAALGARYVVGRDNHGEWAVQHRSKLIATGFHDRQSAWLYALRQSGYRPRMVMIKLGAGAFDGFPVCIVRQTERRRERDVDFDE